MKDGLRPIPAALPRSPALLAAAALALALAVGDSRAQGAAPAEPASQASPASGAPGAVAQAAPDLTGLDISSQVDRSEITIGDRIIYEIRVAYPGEGRIELPSVLGNLGSFEVKDYQASEPKEAGKLKIQTWRFDLSTFTVGTYMIPPQAVVYLPPGAVMPVDPGAPADTSAATARAGGPRPLVFSTQPIEIKVARTSAENVMDIADLAPLAGVPEDRPWVLIGLGAAALLVLAGFLLWRLRRKAAVAEAAKPLLPPFEEAMERLSGLDAAGLVRQNRARELCFELSEILRKYVSRRYAVDALESTTTEFLALVPKLPAPAERRQWIGAFCEHTDLVKFANAPLLESDGRDLADGLKEFLKATRPREDEAAPGKSAEQAKAAIPPPPRNRGGA